jgi:hypothetical protein
MTKAEGKQALARKLNIDYSLIAQNDLFSDADLGAAVQIGAFLAWNYRLWEFSLDALTVTLDADDLTRGYIGYPNTYEDKSAYLLEVNDEEWKKKKFPDYRLYFANNPDAEDEFWADFQRKVFLNANALTAGDEVTIYGKLRAPTLDDDTDLLPFSPENDGDENSGNDAIIEFAYADILSSNKKNKPGEAEAATKKAYRILDTLWDPMAERDSVEQHHDRPFFANVPDFFRGNNGRSTSIGNFE